MVKTPVSGSVAARTDGSRATSRSDRPVHGGPDKAIAAIRASTGGALGAALLGSEPRPAASARTYACRTGRAGRRGSATCSTSAPRACRSASRAAPRASSSAVALEPRSSGLWRPRGPVAGTCAWCHEGVITAGDELRRSRRVGRHGRRGDARDVRRRPRTTRGDPPVLAVDEPPSVVRGLAYMSRARGISRTSGAPSQPRAGRRGAQAREREAQREGVQHVRQGRSGSSPPADAALGVRAPSSSATTALPTSSARSAPGSPAAHG